MFESALTIGKNMGLGGRLLRGACIVGTALVVSSCANSAPPPSAPEAAEGDSHASREEEEKAPLATSVESEQPTPPVTSAESERPSQDHAAPEVSTNAPKDRLCGDLNRLDWRMANMDVRTFTRAREYVKWARRERMNGATARQNKDWDFLIAAERAWELVIFDENPSGGCQATSPLVSELLEFHELVAGFGPRWPGDAMFQQTMAAYYRASDTADLACDHERARVLFLEALELPFVPSTRTAAPRGPRDAAAYRASIRLALADSYLEKPPTDRARALGLLHEVFDPEKRATTWPSYVQSAACRLAEVSEEDGQHEAARALYASLRARVTAGYQQRIDERIERLKLAGATQSGGRAPAAQ